MSGILENAVQGLLTSEVQGLVGLLVSRIGAEINLAWGLQRELEELQSQFKRLSRLLQGASVHPITNPLMADWLKKIKDVAEDVDNLLDEWSYKALEHRTQTRCWDMFMHIISQPFYSLAMAHKVKNISKSIASIYSEATELGIRPIDVAVGDTHAREIEIQDNRLINLRERVDLQFFQGRDADVKELVKLLRDSNNTNSHLTVIGIVGLAGLGKTTLSKHISMKKEVTDFFNPVVIWLVVSYNFDLEKLLKQMVEKVFGEGPTMGGQGLIDKLKTKMMGKKFLIILDDVWDTIDWRTLKSTLLEIGVSQGTTLLVTSRERKVVEKLDTPKEPIIYQLQGLRSSDSWFLFMSIYYYEIEDGSEKEDIAKGLIAKCRGVPLAIRVLAGLLKNDKSIEKWREIEKSKIWTKEDKTDILPSLRLSYNYLPDKALKRCFAFCAIFEEDAVIEKQKLIYMWMAHGFLQHNDKMECMGEDYIERLLSCSLFQEAKWDEYGRVKTFKMHDLVWTLARDVSVGECLCLYLEKTKVENGEVRHLSIRSDSSLRDPFFKSFTKLQTCLLQEVCKSSSLNLLWRCKHLRVLTVGRVGHQMFENFNWKPLGSLIHLRYLNITVRNAGTSSLMHSKLLDQIFKLYHLQTLRIHSLNYSTSHPREPFFLKDICNLVNLRHILMNFHIDIPVRLGHLTALQTLPPINLGLNWGGTRSDMGLLTNLRGNLEIHSLASLTDVQEARSLGLGSKSYLDSLVLDWGNGKKNAKANEILEALQPNEHLPKVEVCSFDGTAFPKWLIGPGSPLKNVVSLQIVRCKEADGNLKLKNFICLRILRVRSCKKLSVTFPSNKSQCCKSLEELEIVYCDKVELLDLSLFFQLRVIEISHNESTNRDNVLVGLGSLRNLRKLDTDLQVPADLGEDSPVCMSLEELILWGSKYNNGDKTYLPEQLQHLVALQCLWLWNLESVEAIPNWLGKLSSLKELIVYGMPKLKRLPPRGVWKSLSNLKFLGCGLNCLLLEKNIENLTREWTKIANIPLIRLS